MDRHLAMQCFCRVVETGSLAAAARDLDCSRAVVSKYVQQLEDWAGSRLLARTTRSMQLTEAGTRFYAYCRRVMDDTEQTLSQLREHSAGLSGRVVISAPVSLTLAFLGEHLHAFQRLHPQIELDVRLNDRPVDLVREGVDLALRGQARLGDSSLVAVQLMQLPRVLCAAPSFWAAHGLPEHPEQLRGLNCLPYRLGEDAGRWLFEGPGGEPHSIEVDGSFRADNSLLLIDAMRRGVGIGLVPEPMVREALARGELVAALGEYRVEPRRLFALYPSRSHLSGRVRALVDFLKQSLAARAPLQ